MKFLRTQVFCILAAIVFCVKAEAQQRVFGAKSFQMDDGALRTLSLDINGPLSFSYSLHFPSIPPPNPVNYVVVDHNGVITWSNNILPPLSAGAIWYGNALHQATELAPGSNGSILSIAGGIPVWTTVLPLSTTVSASQISSGVLPNGTTVTAGPGSVIQPSGTGKVISNELSGSGINKFSASVTIPMNALTLSVSYSGIISTSVVLVSIVDPSGQTVEVTVTSIVPGVGFSVKFAGYYPTSTGQLNYLVIN